MSTAKRVIGIVAVSLVGFGLLVWSAIGNHYVVDVTHSHHFRVDMPFDELRKIMVRTNAAREIMDAGKDSKLISKKWDNKNFDLGKISLRNPNWHINAVGELKIQFDDPYIGKAIAPFTQNVALTPNSIDSLVKLKKPTGRLIGYDVTTRMFPKKNESEVEQTFQMKIETPAPWFAHWYARMRVRRSARRILREQEKHILAAVREHRGQF